MLRTITPYTINLQNELKEFGGVSTNKKRTGLEQLVLGEERMLLDEGWGSPEVMVIGVKASLWSTCRGRDRHPCHIRTGSLALDLVIPVQPQNLYFFGRTYSLYVFFPHRTTRGSVVKTQGNRRRA